MLQGKGTWGWVFFLCLYYWNYSTANMWGPFRNGDPDTTVKKLERGFPGGSMVKSPSVKAKDTSSIPSLGRSHMPWSN